MKTHRLLAIGLIASFLPACDQAEPDDVPMYEFRTSKDHCVSLKSATPVTLKSPSTPDPTSPDDPTPGWNKFGLDHMRSTVSASLAGTVRYMEGADEICSDLCSEAGSEWLGVGCAASEDFTGEVVGQFKTPYGISPVFQLDGEVELGCSCAD